jgi:hypothetical protein
VTDQQRLHVQECLTQVGQVSDLATSLASRSQGLLGTISSRWTDTAALRRLVELVEAAWQVVALLPQEYGAGTQLATLGENLQALRQLCLSHDMDPHRPLGLERSVVLRQLNELRRACSSLTMFLGGCLETKGSSRGSTSDDAETA